MFSKYGARRLERLAVGLASRTPAKTLRVNIPLQEPGLFTNEPTWQDYISRDQLVLRRVTLRAAQANLELGRYVENASAALTMPVLVMLAGQDRIIDNGRTRAFFGQLVHPASRLVEYPDAAHTFEFDPARDAYVRDFADWCHRIVGEV
jgi:alpha-beta hydrolase superfamily lysophospholipase